MNTAYRTLICAPAVVVAVAVGGVGLARGQVVHHEEPALGAEALTDSIAAERGLPPAGLSAEQIEVMVAAAAELMPLLPHEQEGQPGSAVEGFALLGNAVDSLGARGKVALSWEESEAIVAALEARDVRARFCGANCQGRYGDAATSFHVPVVAGDDAIVWILTFWAIGQLPDQPPDRAIYRADELRLRRDGDDWELAGHTVLREDLRLLAIPGAPSQ